MKSIVFILLAAIVVVNAGKNCQLNADCEADECCQIIADIKAIEKRDAEPKTGTCEKLLTEDASCSGADIVNGYCGCAPGLECRGFSIDEVFGRRRRHISNGWDWRCAKPE